MVKLEMEVRGLPDNETDMVDPDFGMVALAMGFKGINVHDPEDVKGYGLSMTNLILGGRMDDVLDIVKSNYKHLTEVV
jgi:pyruvate dehydrogenase (quinone)